MNSNNTVYVPDQLESGNIVHILAVFSGTDEDVIERQLRTGKNPWDLAKELGVLGRLRDELLGRVISYLEVMVQEQQISQEDADEMIACFEMNVPTEDAPRKADTYADTKTQLPERTGTDS